ncbi:MAG TPA: nucleotidyltransferase family protein [Gemmatimonadaceae bacterium]|nr:nucleotidyltransferase family protein [Gemmatimonadaceae bacterium]
MIAAVVLAAGASTRFGSQKLLAPLGGAPLVRRTVERVLAAAGVGDVVVVVGHEGDAVRDALAGLPVRVVASPDYRLGMSSSLHAGVRALAPGTAAALIALGDQPTVTPAIIDALITEWRHTERPIVAPVYAGTRGNPVLFAAPLFPELLAVHGDVGARDVIARSPTRVATVAFDFPMPRDVDGVGDLEGLRDA